MAAKKEEPAKEGMPAPPPAKAPEAKAKKEERKDEPEKGFMSGKLKMVALPLIVAIISYVVITKVVSPKLEGAKVELEKKKKVEMKEEQPGEKPKADMIGQIYAIADIIVNPAGSHGERFVKVSISLEMDEPKLGQELTKRDVQLRDILIGIFTSKTVEEVTNPAKRENLREEVRGKINSPLVSGKIKNVYFTDLVIQ